MLAGECPAKIIRVAVEENSKKDRFEWVTLLAVRMPAASIQYFVYTCTMNEAGSAKPDTYSNGHIAEAQYRIFLRHFKLL